MEIVESTTTTLRSLGKDEVWIHNWIKERPSRLGLGEIVIKRSELVHYRNQGGRLDILGYRGDLDTYYEIEVMLGECDSDHGFRVLDYWARERVKTPNARHVAVLVAEDLSGRYKTVIETLPQFMPWLRPQLWLNLTNSWLMQGIGRAFCLNRPLKATSLVIVPGGKGSPQQPSWLALMASHGIATKRRVLPALITQRRATSASRKGGGAGFPCGPEPTEYTFTYLVGREAQRMLPVISSRASRCGSRKQGWNLLHGPTDTTLVRTLSHSPSHKKRSAIR